MALPATINAGVSWGDHLSGRPGPFLEGTDVFVVVADKTNNHVEVWKSTDYGQTWAEADAANHKSISSTSTFKSYDAVRVGSVITIAYITGASTYSFCDFNMSTGLWGTPVASTAGVALRVDITGNCPIFVARRSNGDTIIFRTGDYTNMVVQRAGWCDRYVSAAWTNSAQVTPATANNYEPHCLLTDGSIVMFTLCEAASADDVYGKPLGASNTLGTGSALDSTAHTTSTYMMGSGVWDGSEFNIPSLDSTNEMDNQRVTVSGTTMTLVSADAISATSTSNPEPLTHFGAMAKDAAGSTLYAFWIADNQTTIYRDSDGGSNTWGTDTAWKTGLGTLTSIALEPVALGGSVVGCLYLEGGVVTYDAYPTPTLPSGSSAVRYLAII